jgi:hypothetical protein
MASAPGTDAVGAPDGGVAVPVAHARPALSTICSLLVIAAGVPLAVLVAADRLAPVIPLMFVDLRAAPDQPGRMLLIGALAACLAGPLCGWLARLWPPWVVLVGALLAIAVGYWQAAGVSSVHDLYLVRGLQGAGAGALLAGTAALVGAASAWTRPFLAALWAATFVGAAAIRTRVVLTPPAAEWRGQLEPVRWLLGLTVVLTLLLALVSVADRRPRLFPRWVDLAALLPLAGGLATALLVWVHPTTDIGLLAVLLALVLLAVLAATLAAALAGARFAPAGSRAAVGSATAAVACVSAAAVAPTIAGIATIKQYALVSDATTRAVTTDAVGDLIAVAAAAGILAALAGALLPEHRRRQAILTGLPAAAAGALLLLPASTTLGWSLPGAALVTGGCGLALGAVLRSVGPLATVVAGGLAAVALTTADLTRGSLVNWWLVGVSSVADPRDVQAYYQAYEHAAVTGQRWWLVLLAALLLGAAAVAALAITRSRPAAHAR